MLMKRAAPATSTLARMRRILDQHAGDRATACWHIGHISYVQLRHEFGGTMDRAFGIPVLVMPDHIGIGLHSQPDGVEPW